MKRKIFFVYNANSSKLYKYIDTIHKIVSPSTYSCGLCSLTHGHFSEKDQWTKFKQKMNNYEFVFIYKNDFVKTYSTYDLPTWYPVIMEKNEAGFQDMLIAEDFEFIDSLEKLIEILEQKLVSS